MSRYFITGIGTGVGKTFISAVLTEALKADYWKPIQCGIADGTDSEKVKALISNDRSVFHKESYVFNNPVSPHLAALLENKKIVMDGFDIPNNENDLIVEGAGGMLVPLTDSVYAIDLAGVFEAEVILVIRNYLGCINHSLLSIDYLVKNDFPLKGIILNGNFDKTVRASIINYSELPIIGEIPEINEITKETVLFQTQKINLSLFE